MRTINQKIQSLDAKSVWYFAKQETAFDDAFRAAQLLSEAKRKNVNNLETYFSQHYERFGLSTKRHRIILISQLFGLVTKTPFFVKKDFLKEQTTAVFDSLSKCKIGDQDYNILKTEQLLKVRTKAIVDTDKDRKDFAISPFLFSYLVLKKLKTDYGITEITEDMFCTYIATCKQFSEVDETAYLLSQPNPKVISKYKSDSRIKSLFAKNNKLIIVEGKPRNAKIKFNSVFDDYFWQNFVSKFDFSELEKTLNNLDAYRDFLYNEQGFNINLIDPPTAVVATIPAQKNNLSSAKQTSKNNIDDDDPEYVESVDEVGDQTIDPTLANGAHKIPVVVSSSSQGSKVPRNPVLGKIAIQQSDYKCDADSAHSTFESKSTRENFMEAHHLVPMKDAETIFAKNQINIDCVENIVSLCPTCHRAIHYGAKKVQEKMIEDLYEKCLPRYQSIGFDITLDEVKSLYDVT